VIVLVEYSVAGRVVVRVVEAEPVSVSVIVTTGFEVYQGLAWFIETSRA
jgi:hypothetical protein